MAGLIRMKTMLVTVLDVGPSMNCTPTLCGDKRSRPSKMAIAKSFFGSYLIERMMASKTTEFCLVTNGDDTTHNYLNQNQGGGYERIHEIFPLTRATIGMIETAHGLSCGSAPGDTIDGIVVGFDILDRTNVGKAFNKVLLLITDGEADILGLEDLNLIIGNMKEKDCAVYVLLLGKVSSMSSSNKIQNAGVLKRIATLTRGRYCEANDLSDCMPIFASAPGLSTKPRQNKFIFEITPHMRVPCITWNKTKSIMLPNMKKAPILVSASSGIIDGDDSYEPPSIKTDITWRNPADEDEEVSLNDRIKGYRYGSQYIPIQGDEEKAFKVPGEQIIQLIGFVASTTVPRHHYLLKSVVLEGNPNLFSAVSTVRSLHNAMITTDTVALVRFVSKQDADPCLSVLIPNINENDRRSSLILQRLPIAEDIREYAYPSYNLDALNKDQKDSLSQFVNAMSISPTSAQLHPFNPTKLDVILEVQKKILNKISSFVKQEELDSFKFEDPLKSIFTGTILVHSMLILFRNHFLISLF